MEEKKIKNLVMCKIRGEGLCNNCSKCNHSVQVSDMVEKCEFYSDNELEHFDKLLHQGLKMHISTGTYQNIIEQLLQAQKENKELKKELHKKDNLIINASNKGIELLKQIKQLKKDIAPFQDGYFKDLSIESIAELAKKSIRLTKVANAAMEMKATWEEFDKVNESEIEKLQSERDKYKVALEKIANNSVKNNMKCKTDKCRNSIGICFECKLKQSIDIAKQALGGEDDNT